MKRAVLVRMIALASSLLTGCTSAVMLHPGLARTEAARMPPDLADGGQDHKMVAVTNKLGNRLRGWEFAAPGNYGVILVGDGNATGIAQTYYYNRDLVGRGFNVLVLGYQGFDVNEGKANIKSLAGDVEAFYRYCQERFPGQPIALVGQSISAGVLFCFASRHPEINCVVLEGVVDLKRVAFTQLERAWPLYPLFPISVPTAAVISAGVPGELSARKALARQPVIPALFIHHPEDPITPFSDACRIFAHYAGPKKLIVPSLARGQGFHMTGNSDARVREEIVRFLNENMRCTELGGNLH